MSTTLEGYEENWKDNSKRLQTNYKCCECGEEFDEGDRSYYQSLAGVCPYCGSTELEQVEEEE